MKKLLALLKREEGIEFVEWALMCAGFALIVWAALGPLSAAVIGGYNAIIAALA